MGDNGTNPKNGLPMRRIRGLERPSGNGTVKPKVSLRADGPFNPKADISKGKARKVEPGSIEDDRTGQRGKVADPEYSPQQPSRGKRGSRARAIQRSFGK